MTDNVLCRGDKTSGNENDLGLQSICPFQRISTSTYHCCLKYVLARCSAETLQVCSYRLLALDSSLFISSLGLYPSCNRYVKTKPLRVGRRICFLLQARKPNLLHPLDHAILNHWVPLKHSEVYVS